MEFKVNEYITLKLESRKTNIYIKDKLFRQCKFLLLFLSIDNNLLLEKVDSIDKASESLNLSLDPNTEYMEPEMRELIDTIRPEEEFWAHCSNLQVWIENGYDTRLLHRSLAFPLLKKLTEEGDLIARKRFKEEIGIRYFTGVKSVQTYLEEEGYLEFLNKEEIGSFIHSGVDIINELEDILKIDLHVTNLREYFTNVLIRNGEIIGLDLSGLNLKEIPDCIQRLKHLEIFSLVGNSIEEIPDWIGKLKLLKQLIVVNNKIKEVTKLIGKLLSLEVLNLAQNELEELPESIGNLFSLKELVLYNNQLKNLPYTIENLSSLEKIFIQRNLLSSLPESVKNLNNLISMNLNNNPINDLPASMCELSSLKKIWNKMILAKFHLG